MVKDQNGMMETYLENVRCFPLLSAKHYSLLGLIKQSIL